MLNIHLSKIIVGRNKGVSNLIIYLYNFKNTMTCSEFCVKTYVRVWMGYNDK